MSIFSNALNQIYNSLGVDAEYSVLPGETLRTIDKTAGVEARANSVDVHTIIPAACVRMHELTDNSLTPDGLVGTTLTMNGTTWRITHYQMRPTPFGEPDGEVYLFLRST